MAEYIALLWKDETSDFGVSFPDFPGCITAGQSLQEARKLAAEALQLHTEGLLEDDEELPDPTALDQIMEERENRDAVAFLVQVPTKQHKAVRINVTFQSDLLERIDQRSAELGLSRSRFLAQAAEAKLHGGE